MEKKPLNLLLLEDDPDDAELEVRELEKEGFDIRWSLVETEEAFREAIKKRPDLIILDHNLPLFDSFAALRILKKIAPEIPAIIVSGTLGEEVAVECLKVGASDYVLKDRLFRLGPVVKRTLEEAELYRAQKQTEEALQESEKKYRNLVESSIDAIYITKLDGKLIDLNPAGLKLFGIKKKDLSRRNAAEFYVNRDDRTTLIKKVSEKAFVKDFEVPLKRTDGSIFHSSITVVTNKDINGKIIGFQGIIRDITERKKAEQKIKEYSENLERMVEERTEELNRALLEAEDAREKIDGILKSVSNGLIVTDMHNRIILMNLEAEDILSIRLSDVIGRPIEYATEEKALAEKLKNTLNKKDYEHQFDFIAPGDDPKHPRTMQARTSLISDREGKETGIVIIIQDITREREVDRMKTEFLSTAAHELRTPLTSIQGFSEIMLNRDNLSQKELKKFLSYINKQAVNLAEIIRDLLDISRIESGLAFSLNEIESGLDEVIESIFPHFERRSSDHRFEVSLPDKPVRLFIDKEKMEQALMNLLDNAVKYSPGGGVIRVAGKSIKNHYQVSVKDQGIGMTAEQVKKIFDKFYRIDASDSAPSGTGLGMTIVKYIVEAHGGKIWVDSVLGKGTTVRFTIPIGSKQKKLF